jgi:photoactive yellow protein
MEKPSGCADKYCEMVSHTSHEDIFELTRERLDQLPFGVVTLNRKGRVLRYNQAEAALASRSAASTIGLDFFADVAPCTNVKAFRGRFDDFAQSEESGVECFDFAFVFRWGLHDVSITMLRKRGQAEINLLVRERSAPPELPVDDVPAPLPQPPP